MKKYCPRVKENAGGRPSNQTNKQPVAKASRTAFPEILAKVLLKDPLTFM